MAMTAAELIKADQARRNVAKERSASHTGVELKIDKDRVRLRPRVWAHAAILS